MKKWIIIGGVALLAVIIVIVAGISNLGPMIKTAVNTYGPNITKTEVRLSDVGISLLSGEAKLKGFYLGNPKGFQSPEAMKVASVYVDVDEKSITGDTIIIDKVEVIGPEINYEKMGRTDNFKTILGNVQRRARAGESSDKQSGSESQGKKLLINNFILKEGKVKLAMSALGRETSVSASLPNIHLKNLGQGGAYAAEVMEEILTALYATVTSPAVTSALTKGLEELGSSVKTARQGAEKDIEEAKKQLEAAGKGDQKALETVADKVKGVLGK